MKKTAFKKELDEELRVRTGKKTIRETAWFYIKAIGLTVYGFAAIISLTYAALSAKGYDLNLTDAQSNVVLASVAIAATPVMWKIGEFIWHGIRQTAAKEAKE